MNLNPVILAIPMYFTLMALELVYESINKRKTYRLNDAITNINAGVLQQLTNVFLALFNISLYVLAYENWAFFQFPANAWTFVMAMVAWDLAYYWAHRMAHEISLFWGGHSVHHQSEDYNLSVALRQTSTGFLWSFPFYLPMALLGISPEHFVLAGGFNLLYQFWIHTEHIKRMPSWFEAIFNTPSHHRVHHGRDPKYIDKNYAGILIIWDRWFGTFKKEEERPNYGVTVPLQSWNPVYANFAHYIELAKQTGQARTWSDRLRILFKPPGWLPDYMGGYQAPKAVSVEYQKYNEQADLRVNTYILVQFLVSLGINALFFFVHKEFPINLKFAFGIWIIWTALMFGFLFERQQWWLTWMEVLRLACIPFGMWCLQKTGFSLSHWGIMLAAMFSGLSVLSLFYLKSSR